MALVLSSLALAACAGSLSFDPDGGTSSGTGGSGGGANSCATAMTVLQTNCAACHGTTPIFAALDLLSPNPETRLVGVAASTTGTAAECGGQGNLLNRGTPPATGILIDKIKNMQTCGVSMPQGMPMLNPTDLACLQAWANGLVNTVGP